MRGRPLGEAPDPMREVDLLLLRHTAAGADAEHMARLAPAIAAIGLALLILLVWLGAQALAA